MISAFITPNEQLRSTVRSVIGDDLIEVYVRCSFEKCRARDVKGLYAKATAGQIAQFTSRGALVDRSCLRSSLASATASEHGETTATVPARQ